MNRRQFVSAGAFATAASASGVAPSADAAETEPFVFKLGASARTEDQFRALGRWGIHHVYSSVAIPEEGRIYPTAEELSALVDLADKYDVEVVIYTPPILSSSHIDRERNPGIMLGKEPERSREIEAFQTTLKNCAAAGIPCVKYNLSILGVLRSGTVPGRGDTTYGAWNLKTAQPPDPPLTRAGRVTADMYWERITYFLERVVPVANEYQVRIACHPQDSPTAEWQGVVPVLGTVEGLKRFVSIQESPYHGLNFCQGTVAEMLHNPGEEIYEHIRWFAEREKIFNVHFRNIRGGRDDFAEVGIDEGDVDMYKAMLIYINAGYPYMIQPDHNVRSPSDNGGDSEAFQYGYIRGLMHAAERSA